MSIYHTASEKKMQYLIKIPNQENNTNEKSGAYCLFQNRVYYHHNDWRRLFGFGGQGNPASPGICIFDFALAITRLQFHGK